MPTIPKHPIPTRRPGSRSDRVTRLRRVHSRSRSARHLLSARQLRESLRIVPLSSPRIAWVAGLQAALAVLAALATTHVSPWPQFVGFPALGALAALFGRFDSYERRRKTVFLSGFLLTVGVLLPSIAARLGAPMSVMVLILAALGGVWTVAVPRWRLGSPGAVIFVFATGAVLGAVDSWWTVAARGLGTLWGAALAWVICALTDRLRPVSDMAPTGAPGTGASLSHQMVVALRITVGAALSALVAYAAGWHYPAWAAIGATAVMQGGHLHLTMNRSLQRMAGTVVGACLAWAVLVQEPSFWATVAAIVVFQFVTEVVIGYNYALGQITVTPMALLMTHLASPLAATDMPVERVLDTIVGAALGIVLAVVFSSLDDRAHLARQRRPTS